MKRIKLICILLTATVFFVDVKAESEAASAITYTSYTELEVYEVLSQIKPSYVIVTAKGNTDLYKEASTKSEKILSVPHYAEFIILRDISAKWYYVQDTLTMEVGWIQEKFLSIPENEKAETTKLSEQTMQMYLKIMDITSDTNMILWTDIKRQRVYILEQNNFEWKIKKTMVCATGLNESPTIIGNYRVRERGEWFYAERFDSGAKYWVRFFDSYLFHSVSMNKKGEIIDSTLGEKCSNGCIRLSLNDAKWIYESVPKDTAVIIR